MARFTLWKRARPQVLLNYTAKSGPLVYIKGSGTLTRGIVAH